MSLVVFCCLLGLSLPIQAAPTSRKAAAPAARKAASATPKKATSPRPAVMPRGMGKRIDMSRAKVKKGWDYPYLFAAYLLTWILFLLYVFSLRKRLHSSEQELRRLERMVEDVLKSEDDEA
jgi:CcmD family protein